MAKGMGLALSGYTQGLRQGEDDVRRQQQHKQQQRLGGLRMDKAEFDLEQAPTRAEREQKRFDQQSKLTGLRTEKAGFGLNRAKKQVGREDQQREREAAFDRGMKALVASRGQEVGPIQDYLNSYVMPGKNRIEIQRVEEDQFQMIGVKENGEAQPLSPKPMAFDDLGRAIMALRDPEQVFANKGKAPVTVSEGAALVDPRTGKVRYKNPKSGGSGPGGVDTGDYNALKGGLRDMFARMDPEGNIFMPEGSDVEYGKALEIGNDLIAKNIPIGRASRMAYAAVRGPLSEAEARAQARVEAKEQNFGWREDDKETAFIDKRAKEIVHESRQALREYEQLMSQGQRGGRGLPGAAKQQGAPMRSTIDRGGQQPPAQPEGAGQISLPEGYESPGQLLQDAEAAIEQKPEVRDQVIERLRNHGFTERQLQARGLL